MRQLTDGGDHQQNWLSLLPYPPAFLHTSHTVEHRHAAALEERERMVAESRSIGMYYKSTIYST